MVVLALKLDLLNISLLIPTLENLLIPVVATKVVKLAEFRG